MPTASNTRPEQLDIGLILAAPAKDPEWLTKCAVMGLIMLIPIVGGLNLSGWTKAIADRRAAGDMLLPPAGLSYIGAGWRLFVAWLPLVFVLLGAMGTLGAAAVSLFVAGDRRGGGASGEAELLFIVLVLAMYAVIFAVSGLATIVGPAVNFLHIVDGERFASVTFKRQWEVMKEGGTQYLLLFVAVLLAGLVAQLGVLALFVGVFISAPYAQAMQGVAIAEFARVLRPKSASAGFDVDGGIGGTSGSPFGVSR
jgi:hypothetical protein